MLVEQEIYRNMQANQVQNKSHFYLVRLTKKYIFNQDKYLHA